MNWTRALFLVGLLVLAGCTASATTAELQNLSITAEQLREAFNQHSDRARLILVFSPT